jgi:predicted DNA binding protein
MIRTYLEISSKDYYSCELTKKIPVKVTIVTIQLPEGYGYVEPLEGGEHTIQIYTNALKSSKSILEFEITYKSEDVYWTRIVHKLDFPSIYETVLESGNMSLLPITILNGVQYHTVLSPSRDALRTLLKTLKRRFTTVKILSLHSEPLKSKTTLLTQKQLEAFKLAFNQGYYQIPRRIKIEDLAKKLDVKRVAVQERLRRAEIRIFTEYIKNIQSF